MTDNLDTLSDAELSEAFAVEVAGGRIQLMQELVPMFFMGMPVKVLTLPDGSRRCPMPSFATSADAVLPWLEKACTYFTYSFAAQEIQLHGTKLHYLLARGTFPRAAVIALLRAHRAKKSL